MSGSYWSSYGQKSLALSSRCLGRGVAVHRHLLRGVRQCRRPYPTLCSDALYRPSLAWAVPESTIPGDGSWSLALLHHAGPAVSGSSWVGKRHATLAKECGFDLSSSAVAVPRSTRSGFLSGSRVCQKALGAEVWDPSRTSLFWRSRGEIESRNGRSRSVSGPQHPYAHPSHLHPRSRYPSFGRILCSEDRHARIAGIVGNHHRCWMAMQPALFCRGSPSSAENPLGGSVLNHQGVAYLDQTLLPIRTLT